MDVQEVSISTTRIMGMQVPFHLGCSNVNDINESKNAPISKLIIGSKAKRFDLIRLKSERKQNVLVWSEFFVSKAVRFRFGP
jgi:hypothetical protein